MRFITRNGVTRISSYEMYLLPYDMSCWIGILSTSLCIPIVCIFINAQGTDYSVTRARLFLEVVWIDICLLLNVSPTVRRCIMERKAAFILSIGVWLVLLVVLVNAYLGVIVNDLIILPPWTKKYDRLEDMPNFVLYGPDAFQKAEELSNFGDQITILNVTGIGYWVLPVLSYFKISYWSTL